MRSAIESMSTEDCVTLLSGTTTVGRIAFQSSAGQELLPVNFVFRGGRVYFKTSRESMLAELATTPAEVAFEIDYPDRMTQHGWSVLVKGKAREVAEAEIDLSPEPARPWGPRSPRPWAPGLRDVLIEVTPEQITGRRIRNNP
ncbi:MAG: pyridoxamine 5'-phosphate oxidase family protein [Aeromicrobium sp.]